MVDVRRTNTDSVSGFGRSVGYYEVVREMGRSQ